MKIAKIIVLSGQSNAVGVGYVKYLTKHVTPEKMQEYSQGYENIKINYFSHDKKSDGFVPVTVNQAELTKDTFGPEVGMAEYLNQVYPGEEYFIVKCAFGGRSLYHDFLSPSSGEGYDPDAYADPVITPDGAKSDRIGWAYNELVNLLQESIELLGSQGYEPQVAAFCWMQGESDATYIEHTEKYGERYGAMLSDLRNKFAPYMNDCVYVDAGISQRWNYWQQMNEVKVQFAAEHERCHYLDTIGAGLTTCYEPEEEPDTAHYDSDCTIQLGRMFAEKVNLG